MHSYLTSSRIQKTELFLLECIRNAILVTKEAYAHKVIKKKYKVVLFSLWLDSLSYTRILASPLTKQCSSSGSPPSCKHDKESSLCQTCLSLFFWHTALPPNESPKCLFKEINSSYSVLFIRFLRAS